MCESARECECASVRASECGVRKAGRRRSLSGRDPAPAGAEEEHGKGLEELPGPLPGIRGPPTPGSGAGPPPLDGHGLLKLRRRRSRGEA